MSGVRHVELLSRIGLAGATVYSYREKVKNPAPKIEKCLNAVDFYTGATVRFFGRVGSENVSKIADKVDQMEATSHINKPRSILTLIDFSIELLESSIIPDETGKALASFKGQQGIVYVRRLIQSLVDLRDALSPKQDFACCSVAGIKAADIWRQL